MAATFGLGVLVLLLLIALAVPIGFALGLGGVLSLGMLVPTGTIEALMSKVVRDTSASYVFLTIPMFVLMAEFLSVGRVAEDLFLSCNRVLRKIRGGMAMAVIVAGAIHAAVTGSSTASAASLSRAPIPRCGGQAMIRLCRGNGSHRRHACGDDPPQRPSSSTA